MIRLRGGPDGSTDRASEKPQAAGHEMNEAGDCDGEDA